MKFVLYWFLKNGQNSDTEMGSALKGNEEHREQVVANIQAAAAGNGVILNTINSWPKDAFSVANLCQHL